MISETFAIIAGAAVAAALLGIVYAMAPTCGPGEVHVRGAYSMVCVKGHR